MISVAGMFLNFAALARLPLVDATAISFASPLITVALRRVVPRRARARLSLDRGRGRLRRRRRDAVAVSRRRAIRRRRLGDGAATVGAVCGLLAAFTNAGSVIQTRRLTDTETTSSIVFYFSLFCALAGLATLPFGWIWPSALQLAVLIGPASSAASPTSC